MPTEDAPPWRIDIAFLLNNNDLGFAQSARRHRIGRARVESVLLSHTYVEIEQGGRRRLLWVGADWSGRRLEVVAVIETQRLIVIHAMDARPKLIRLYAERFNRGTH